MNLNPPTERMAELLEHVHHHWEEKRRATTAQSGSQIEKSRAYTIAISREAGVDDASVALEIGSLLKWPVYDRELLKRIAEDTGMRLSLLESVDERNIPWLQETFELVLGEPHVSEGAYVHHLVRTLLALASLGECVIVGRGAAQVLPCMSTLRVRLIAPLESRIEFMRRKLGLSQKESARRVKTIDREHRQFVRSHFFKDPFNPQGYDLVLNFARLSVAGCARLTIDALRCVQHPAQPWQERRRAI